jgi:hypothetical protein
LFCPQLAFSAVIRAKVWRIFSFSLDMSVWLRFNAF